MAKKKENKGRPEYYEKSNLKIKGTFGEAMKVFFVKPKEQPKPDTGGEHSSG